MSSENGDMDLLNQVDETNMGSNRKSRIKYTRDFLILLSELDVCKKLPRGFNQSILSEFEDASHDRPRISGGSSLQSFRRNDYGSSPPTKGDSSNFSRGMHGRWDSRSSGRSDKDSDSQSDKDSDSGRRYDNQTRRYWQVPEHDGLLGSGSFPIPAVYTGVASNSKLRANDHSQLNKTNEPYQPPRPYKATPHLRREVNDSYNNETFGSSEITSEDRAEEERKRRASFELMRKEQHKSFQNKDKLNPGKRDDFDITSLSEDSKEERRLSERNESDEILMALNNNSEKSSHPAQTPATRPLVPPGFSSTILDRNCGTKSSVHPLPAEAGNSELDAILLGKGNSMFTGISDNQEEKQSADGEQQHESTSVHVSTNKGGKMLNISSDLDVAGKASSINSQLYQPSNLSETYEALENSEVIELDASKLTVNKVSSKSNQGHSASILATLFGSDLTINRGDASSLIQHHDTKTNETLSPCTFQSSKFAHWFPEEDSKAVDDLSSIRPRNLLSLIVGGEKCGPQASELKATKQILPDLPFQISELSDGHMTSNVTSATVRNTEQLYDNDRSNAVPTVLTCEDLEQSILSEVSENGSNLRPPVPDRIFPDVRTDHPKVGTKDRASQHLLSLLQKVPDPKDLTPFHNLDIRSSDTLQRMEGPSICTELEKSRNLYCENTPNSGNSQILETLFGTEFMKELHSVGAPVSSQRGPDGSARVDVSDPQGISFPIIDGGPLPPTIEIRSNRTSHENSALASNQRQNTISNRTEERWVGFGHPQTEMGLSQIRTDLGLKRGSVDPLVEIQLPEEDNLISVSDPLNLHNVMHDGNPAKAEYLSSRHPSLEINERRTALNSVFKDERSAVGGREDPSLFRGPYDLREPDISYQNLHVQPSFPQIHPPQLNHMGPLHRPLDAYPANINSNMKYIPSEGFSHLDPSVNQLPANMIHSPFPHNNAGLSGLSAPTHHPMLQQMHMAGKFHPPHLMQGFSRGTHMPPPHANNPVSGIINESGPIQGVPFARQQPNFGGLGMPPAPDVGGSNHPEALQRLIGMDRRPSSQQIHPFAAAGHSRGMHGHEDLNTGFGYR